MDSDRMNDKSYGSYGAGSYGTSDPYRYDWRDASRGEYGDLYASQDDGPSRSGLILGAALTAAGLFLIFRSLANQGDSSGAHKRASRGVEGGKGIEVRERVTVNKSASELYRYWRNLSNLPQIMSHLKSVEEQGPKRSHWVAKGPLNTSVEWDAEITEETEPTRIAWRSLEGSQVPNEGSVRFQERPGENSTEVHVHLKYQPPMGPVGMAVAKLFGEEPSQQVGEDLRRFKQRMETGEIATTDGQTSGRAG